MFSSGPTRPIVGVGALVSDPEVQVSTEHIVVADMVIRLDAACAVVGICLQPLYSALGNVLFCILLPRDCSESPPRSLWLSDEDLIVLTQLRVLYLNCLEAQRIGAQLAVDGVSLAELGFKPLVLRRQVVN